MTAKTTVLFESDVFAAAAGVFAAAGDQVVVDVRPTSNGVATATVTSVSDEVRVAVSDTVSASGPAMSVMLPSVKLSMLAGSVEFTPSRVTSDAGAVRVTPPAGADTSMPEWPLDGVRVPSQVVDWMFADAEPATVASGDAFVVSGAGVMSASPALLRRARPEGWSSKTPERWVPSELVRAMVASAPNSELEVSADGQVLCGAVQVAVVADQSRPVRVVWPTDNVDAPTGVAADAPPVVFEIPGGAVAAVDAVDVASFVAFADTASVSSTASVRAFALHGACDGVEVSQLSAARKVAGQLTLA